MKRILRRLRQVREAAAETAVDPRARVPGSTKSSDSARSSKAPLTLKVASGDAWRPQRRRRTRTPPGRRQGLRRQQVARRQARRRSARNPCRTTRTCRRPSDADRVDPWGRRTRRRSEPRSNTADYSKDANEFFENAQRKNSVGLKLIYDEPERTLLSQKRVSRGRLLPRPRTSLRRHRCRTICRTTWGPGTSSSPSRTPAGRKSSNKLSCRTRRCSREEKNLQDYQWRCATGWR